MTDPKRPSKDLGAVFDAHVRAEFVDKDVAEPYLTHVPTLAGGTGRKEVESFYRSYFVGHWPDDVEVRTLSRTVGEKKLPVQAKKEPCSGKKAPCSRLRASACCGAFFRPRSAGPRRSAGAPAWRSAPGRRGPRPVRAP
jgi:hypothetical protein